MNKIEIKDWYEHEHAPSVFIMFAKDYKLFWCMSGNELRRCFLLDPDAYISGPIEVAVTPELYEALLERYEHI